MARDDKTCIVCGKAYKYCEGCPSKYDITQTWRNIFCSENCREVYHVYDSIKAGKLKDEEAGKMLSKYDTSIIFKMREPMKSVLTIALNSNQKIKKKTASVIENSNEVDEGAPKKRGRKKNSEVDSKG